jgi:hypothetical protein
VDLARARLSEDPGALAQGGACREDIVHEEAPAGHGSPPREGARDVRPARAGGELDLVPGPAHDLQFIQNGRVYPPRDPRAISSAWLKPRFASCERCSGTGTTASNLLPPG